MDLVFQATTPAFDFALKDQDGTLVPKAGLSSLTAKLYDLATGEVINGRDYTSILDANGGVVNADGTGTLTLSAADNPIVSSSVRSGDTEEHGIAIKFTAGAVFGAGRMTFLVEKLP